MKLLKNAIAALCLSLAACTCAQAAEIDIYTVQHGDTLWIISQKYMVKFEDVISANPQLENPEVIFPGEKIYVPFDDDGSSGDNSSPKRKGGKNWNYNRNKNNAANTAPETPSNGGSPSGGSNPAGGGTASEENSFEMQVLELVNKERAKQGLPPLSYAGDVASVARAKSNDMISENYFSHTSPKYGSPFDMLKHFGVSYKTAGENIAKGQKTPEAVMTSWMNSEGHRKNILSASFKEIGVGYATDSKGTPYWTQIFIAR